MDGFVKAKMHTVDGKTIEVMYETWNRQLYGNKDFNPTKKFLDNMKTGNELIKAMRKWFLDSTDEDEYFKEGIYARSEYSSQERELNDLKREDMQLLEISSLLNWDNAGTGYGSEITYDFTTKERTRKNTGWY